MTVTFRQAFRYQLFQADLHPDNVILLPRDVVTYADWSSFAELDSGLADDELAYLSAVFDGDVERALDPPTDLVAFDDEGDVAAFRRDVLSHLRERSTVESDQRPQSAPLELLAELLRAARVHRIGLSEGGRLLFRAVVAAGSTAERLDADVATTDVARRALGAARVGGKIRELQPERVERTVFDLARLLRDTPGHLHKILSELADGSFSMNVWVAEVAQAERNRNRRARLLVAAIASVSLAVVLTAPHFARVGGVSLAWPVVLALALVYGWLALEWRRLR
jgi:predicted unusual protein kinase regulating ubiquinone biosynthesis (AarF/ABC1/UbiB family)